MVAFKSVFAFTAIAAVSAANVGAGVGAALDQSFALYLPVLSNVLSSGLNFTNPPSYINDLVNAYKDNLYTITIKTIASIPATIANQPPSNRVTPKGAVEDAAVAKGAYNIIESAFNQTILSYNAAAKADPPIAQAAATLEASLNFVLDLLTKALATYKIAV